MRIKRVATLGLCLCIMSTMFFGCSVDSDTPIIGSLFGLNDDQTLKVDKLICSKPEYMLQLMDTANRHKAGFGGTVNWNAKVTGEKTLNDYTFDEVKECVSTKYVVASMANEYSVNLTEGEKDAIKSAAKEYYSNLTAEEKDFTKAKESDVEKVYQNYKLADKVFEKVTEDQDVTVSDEETRAAEFMYIRLNSDKHKVDYIKSKLKEVTKIINNNYQPFSREAKQYSDDNVFRKTIYKNEAKKKYEKHVFDMDSETLSDILVDGKDYYLIWCIDNYLKKESAEHKAELIKEKKQEYFNQKYEEYLDDVSTDFNSSSIEDVKLPR